MAKTKDPLDKLVENQQHLVETLTEQAQKAMHLFEVDPAFETFTKETTDAYMTKGKEYVEAMTPKGNQENPWENLPTVFGKFVEMQADTFTKTTDFFRHWAEQNPWTAGQEKFKEATDIYRDSMKAIVETTSANTELMQEMFKRQN
jgi:hypothetical protein